MSSGTLVSSYSAPVSSDFQIKAFSSKSKTMPLKVSSTPIGKAIMAGLAPSLSLTSWTVAKKSAPSLSILLTKQRRGTLYLLA